jgi:hypothetical protein
LTIKKQYILRFFKKKHSKLVCVEADKDLALMVITKEKYRSLCYDHLMDESTYYKIGKLNNLNTQS